MSISSQTFVQSTPALAWTVNHGFGGAPICDVTINDNGVIRKILPLSVKYVSDTQLLIEFNAPVAGTARLVGKYIAGVSSGVGSVDLGQFGPPNTPPVSVITFDQLKTSTYMTLSNGNLTATANTGSYEIAMTDIPVTTGKYYWEITVDQLAEPSDMYVGLCAVPTNLDYDEFFANPQFGPYGALRSLGTKFTTGTGSGNPQPYTAGTVIGIAVDLDADKMWFSINGAWSFGEDPAAGTGSSVTNAGFGSGPVYPFVATDNNVGIVQASAAFSVSQYVYAIPSGFSDFSALTTPVDPAVVLLLRGEGPNGSTTIVDSSPFARTMTASGVTISNVDPRFGTGSMYFQNGSITTPHTEEMAFGTGSGGNGDFTLEVQWKPDTIDGLQNIINVAGYNTGILWRNVGGAVDVFLSGEQLFFGGDSNNCFTAGVWQHAALVRHNGMVGMFINGIQRGNWVPNSLNLAAGTQTVWVGRAAHVTNEPLTGYLDEVRICRTAKYTGNFTPPSAPFP